MDETEFVTKMAGLRPRAGGGVGDIRIGVWSRIAQLPPQEPQPRALPLLLTCAIGATLALTFSLLELSSLADESLWHPHFLAFWSR